MRSHPQDCGPGAGSAGGFPLPLLLLLLLLRGTPRFPPTAPIGKYPGALSLDCRWAALCACAYCCVLDGNGGLSTNEKLAYVAVT